MNYKKIHCSGCVNPDKFGGTHCYGNVEHGLAPKTEHVSKKIIKQATDYSNLSQWIQMEVWKERQANTVSNSVDLAGRIIKRVLEYKNEK